jgi:hypothetical protein
LFTDHEVDDLLGFQIGAAPRQSRLLGLYDEYGLVDPRLRPTRDEFRQWRDALERETFSWSRALSGTLHRADNEEHAEK